MLMYDVEIGYVKPASLLALCCQRYEDAANAFYEGVQLDSSNVEMAKAFQ